MGSANGRRDGRLRDRPLCRMVSPAATAVLASLHTPVADRPRWMVACGNLEKGNNAGPANRNRDKPVLAHRNNLRPGPRLPHGPAHAFSVPGRPKLSSDQSRLCSRPTAQAVMEKSPSP